MVRGEQMKRFRNILYILDAGPDREAKVTTVVQNLARINRAKVRAVKILEETIFDSVGRQFSNRLQSLIDLERQHASNRLEQVLSTPGWDDVQIVGELLNGKDFIAAIRKVLFEEHDLVVKARNTLEDHDSFAMRLFRKCPCPVYIINTETKGLSKIVLGAVDLVDTVKESWQLNRKIVELTCSLAEREHGEAHFVHAWQLEYEKTMRGPRFRFTEEEIQTMKQDIAAARVGKFEQLLAETGFSVDAQHIHLLEGDPSQVIQKQLIDLQADVLVMGSVARAGLPGLLIGNKAEDVLSQVQCTVLAVKPNGFISPVTL